MATYRVWAASGFYSTMHDVVAEAKRAEAMGFDCFAVIDSVHDGLMAAALAVQATERIQIATSALACFPRSPMTTAVAVRDLQEFSGGRFRLGLGPLIKPVITRKYSTPWYAPAPRMREYILAMRAIFACWQEEQPLDFRGQFYQFTLQQAYSRPPKLKQPKIPLHLAAIGPHMTALAGELADAIMPHPTNTSARFLREITRPGLARGAARTGRSLADIELFANILWATGDSKELIAKRREQHRRTLATLYSTPNYWPDLTLHGWHDRGERLKKMMMLGEWDEMPALVSDEMLDTFVPAGHHSEIAAILQERYGDAVSSFCFPLPEDPSEDRAVASVVRQLQGR